ncbi:MAG: type II toxin-antitoxin system RelE/ParE family toxin [Chloracidobacterium sp.]|nr:type II toxin-antitoxin system RelE/ParE family toxin [Chloracidobacterium sp.]
MARYIVSSEAEQDITEIVLFIAEENVDAAIGLKDRFHKVFDVLVDNPRAGRERDELAEGLRSFPVGSYIVFYRLWAGDIAIARIIHAARDFNEIC